MLPYAAGARLTILSYGALCRGLLSGRMTAEAKFNGDDLRKVDPKFESKRYTQYLAAVGELKKLAHERFGKIGVGACDPLGTRSRTDDRPVGCSQS